MPGTVLSGLNADQAQGIVISGVNIYNYCRISAVLAVCPLYRFMEKWV